jgi:hypothetical protein
VIDPIEIDLTDAIEAAATIIAKEGGVDLLAADSIIRLVLLEAAAAPVKAAAPFIIQAVLRDITTRTYAVKP